METIGNPSPEDVILHPVQLRGYRAEAWPGPGALPIDPRMEHRSFDDILGC